MKRKDVTILIPAYKPDEKLLKLIDRLIEAEYDIVVVNDGSGEKFQHIFDSIHSAKVIEYPVNKGKGGALKTGISYINENTSAKYIITADADGQHTPEDITKLADFLVSSKNDSSAFVIGSRKFTGEVPFKSKYGNKITIGAFALASGVKIGDTQTGLRGFSKGLFSELCQIDGDRYEYEINVLLHIAKRKIKINEIEIETIYIDENASSHFHPVRDSIKIYSCILKYCFSSIISFIVDFILAHIFSFILSPVFSDGIYKIGSIASFSGGTVTTALSTAFARIISMIVNFTLNKKFVFKSNEKSSSIAIKYFSLAAFNLVLNSIITSLLKYYLDNLTIAYIIAQIPVYILNYIIQKKFIFKA